MRGIKWGRIRKGAAALATAMVVLAGPGVAYANGNPPPANPPDPVLRPLPAGEPVGQTWHNSLSCASDTENQAIAYYTPPPANVPIGAHLNVNCYGPPGIFATPPAVGLSCAVNFTSGMGAGYVELNCAGSLASEVGVAGVDTFIRPVDGIAYPLTVNGGLQTNGDHYLYAFLPAAEEGPWEVQIRFGDGLVGRQLGTVFGTAPTYPNIGSQPLATAPGTPGWIGVAATPTAVLLQWYDTDGNVRQLTFTNGPGASEHLSDAGVPNCSFTSGVGAAGYVQFDCTLRNPQGSGSPLGWGNPFTADPSRGMVAASFAFANGLVVSGSQTEPGEPNGWPAYIDPALATDGLTPTPFSRFGPALDTVAKLGCDLAQYASAPVMANATAVTAAESVVWTLDFYTAGTRTVTITDTAASAVAVTSTATGLHIVMPAFVYPAALAAGVANPVISCVNAAGSNFTTLPLGSGPGLGGTPQSISDCMTGAGFAVNPSSWLPALATVLGCVAQVLFVPTDWSRVTTMWRLIQTKAPMSFVYDALAFLPASATALAGGIAGGSCASSTPTLSGLTADPTLIVRAPCVLGTAGGAPVATLRSLVYATFVVMLSVAVLKATSRVMA